MTDLKDVELVLHIGLHKTASTYVQNVLGARRYDLLAQDVLYPTTGTADEVTGTTREGANNGHVGFTRAAERPALMEQLTKELPANVTRVLLSAEDFTHSRARRASETLRGAFGAFGSVQVVLVVRRQDHWVESWYKQLVDQWRGFETRSLDQFVAERGPVLFDFHERFSGWRDLAGPENFHLLSYDDLDGGDEICRRILGVAGVDGSLLDDTTGMTVPRYDSIRAVDTLGLRILNSYRIPDRDVRTAAARNIYSLAPDGEVELMSPELREGIQKVCDPVNERIEAEWSDVPLPGFRFRDTRQSRAVEPVRAEDLVTYVDEVMAVCEAARASTAADAPAEPGA